MTSRCPGCSKEVGEGDALCPHCGRDFSPSASFQPPAAGDSPPRRELPPRRGRFQTTEWEEAPQQDDAASGSVRAPRPWLTLAAMLAGAFTLFVFGSWAWRRAHRASASSEVVAPAEIEAGVDIDQRPMDILVDRQPAFPPPAHPSSPRSLESIADNDAPGPDAGED